MPNIHDRKILIINSTWKESETFIRDHAEHLPGEVDVLYDIYEPNSKLLSKGPNGFSRLFDNEIVKKISYRLHWSQNLGRVRIAKLIRQVEPDVILFEYGPTASHFVSFLKKTSIPFVVHFHGYDASVESNIRENIEEYRWLIKNAQAIVAVSSEMREKILSWVGGEGNVVHITYGVNEIAFSSADGYKHSLNFLSVGGFVEKKAPHLLVKAFAKVVNEVPECRLIMVGDGGLRPATEALAGELRIADNIDFMGWVPRGLVSEFMRQAGCFVQHSVRAANGDSEGTPVAIIEAMATGLPVVTTAHAGIKDIIKSGRTGLLVSEYDIEGMAEAMLRIAREPDLAGHLGAEARRYVLDNLTLSKSIGKLSDLLTIGR